MKICLVTRSFNLAGGGIGRVSTGLLEGLTRKGHTVHTISTKGLSLTSYFRYTMLELPLRLPSGYDIYHAVTPMESIWLPSKRSVATVLDIIPITHPEKHGARMSGNRVKYTIGKLCFHIGCIRASRCQGIACISEHVKQEFTRRYNNSTVEVIRLGIREDLEPNMRKDKVFRVGYLGQLDRRKRVGLLIGAFKRSSLDRLIVGGAGLDRDSLEKSAGGDKRIKFYGLVPDENLVDFYNSLDVLIFPTSIEGYGLPPIEAMACRKPVIVLADAIIPKDVRDRCIVVDSLETTLESKDLLEGLLKDVDYEDNYIFAKKHSWTSCTDEYIRLYERILAC